MQNLTRDIWVYSLYASKSHPRYLSFPGFTAMTLDVEKFRRRIPHSKRPETRVEKIMQASGSPGLISDIYLLFCLLSVVATTKKINIMAIDLFIVNDSHCSNSRYWKYLHRINMHWFYKICIQFKQEAHGPQSSPEKTVQINKHIWLSQCCLKKEASLSTLWD